MSAGRRDIRSQVHDSGRHHIVRWEHLRDGPDPDQIRPERLPGLKNYQTFIARIKSQALCQHQLVKAGSLKLDTPEMDPSRIGRVSTALTIHRELRRKGGTLRLL
jgi:hypothetical protein